MTNRDQHRRRGRSTPRQDRSIETRSRLLDAGLRAFAAKGHDGVSLARDVLEPSGVSVGSFYHQFADKTDLLLAILEEHGWARRRDVTMSAVQGATLDESVERGMAEFFDDLDTNELSWRLRLRIQQSADPRIRQSTTELLARWTEQNLTLLSRWADGTDPAVRELAAILTAFGIGLATTYLDLDTAERAARRPAMVAASMNFMAHGLGVPSGVWNEVE